MIETPTRKTFVLAIDAATIHAARGKPLEMAILHHYLNKFCLSDGSIYPGTKVLADTRGIRIEIPIST